MKYSANSFRISFASWEGFLAVFGRSVNELLLSFRHAPFITCPFTSASKVPAGVYRFLDVLLFRKKIPVLVA